VLGQDCLHELDDGIRAPRLPLILLLLAESRIDRSYATRGNRQPCGPRAIDANFVYWFMNARWTVPVGPFLCFATMSSASPLASESWL
jgi:hypothetical protein